MGKREPLIKNTQIRELVRKFYKKIPDCELAAVVTRLTGEPCEPGYIRQLARVARRPKDAIPRGKLASGRPRTVDVEGKREAGKSAVNEALASLTEKERNESVPAGHSLP